MSIINKHRYAIVIIVCVCVFTVLVVLGARAHPLWGDEAETGLYAENLLKFGVLKGWDGVNLMGHIEAVSLNKDLINYSNPWPQYYLTAVSFQLFGVSSFTARLPFILLGILSIPLLYLLGTEIGGKRIGIWSAIIASTSVQYILFSYQTRYYSVVDLFGLLFLYLALRLVRQSKKEKILCILSGIIFIYSNYISFPFFYISVGIAISTMYFMKKERVKLKDFFVHYTGVGIIIVLTFIPWYLWFHPGDRALFVSDSVVNYIISFPSYFGSMFTQYHTSNVLPLGIVMLAIVMLVVHKKRFVIAATGMIIFVYMMLVTIVSMATVTDSSLYSFRYHTILIPIGFICIACSIDALWQRNRYVAVCVGVLYIGTNIFTFHSPRSFMVEYIGEIVHPYETAGAVVAEYLDSHAAAGDTVFVDLDRAHEPIIFLLKKPLRFVNRVSPANDRLFPKNFSVLPSYIYAFVGEPVWIITFSEFDSKTNDVVYDKRPLPVGVKLEKNYQKIILPIYFLDMSRPEMYERSFQEIQPKEAERVFIYHRKPV